MEIGYIFLYFTLNLIIFFYYYKQKLGVFQGPFLLAFVSLFVILPQYVTIYTSVYYDNELIPLLSYVMISGNLAFVFGYEITKKRIKSYPNGVNSWEFDFDRLKYCVLFFSIIGLISLVTYGNKGVVNTGDPVLSSNLKAVGTISLVMSMVAILYKRNTKFYWFTAFLGIVPIINFAFFVKGSRGDTLTLIILSAFFISLYKPILRRKLKLSILIFLVLGGVANSSITIFRHWVAGEEVNILEAFSFETFENSFDQENYGMGMDLGNAANGIQFCYKYDTYDFGFQLWNGFVYNVIPGRFIGEDLKASLQIPFGYEAESARLTTGVTTMTGYFSSFSSFSFFCFFMFGLVGAFYGWLWRRSKYSSFALFLSFYILCQIPLMVTHSLQYVFFPLEVFFVYIFPVLFVFRVVGIKKHKTIS